MSEILSLEFVQNLLKDDYPDVTVQRFEGAPGSKRGDNYTSMVYRISLYGIRKHAEADGSSESEEPWEGSIIYKCLPESTTRREAFKSDVLFCNEVSFYNKIWPALDNFQKQWLDRVKTPFQSIPKCYLAQNDLVILKDLKEVGKSITDTLAPRGRCQGYVGLPYKQRAYEMMLYVHKDYRLKPHGAPHGHQSAERLGTRLHSSNPNKKT